MGVIPGLDGGGIDHHCGRERGEVGPCGLSLHRGRGGEARRAHLLVGDLQLGVGVFDGDNQMFGAQHDFVSGELFAQRREIIGIG